MTNPHLKTGVDSTPETLSEKHFRQWIPSNKFMLQIKHYCHKPFELHDALPTQSSFSNPSVASLMSQFILQPFRCFTYVTAHSPTLPLLHLCHSSFSNLRHSSFSNPYFVSPTSQALHLRHLASRP